MELSKVVACLALILGAMLATGYARGDGPNGPAVRQTVQERPPARGWGRVRARRRPEGAGGQADGAGAARGARGDAARRARRAPSPQGRRHAPLQQAPVQAGRARSLPRGVSQAVEEKLLRSQADVLAPVAPQAQVGLFLVPPEALDRAEARAVLAHFHPRLGRDLLVGGGLQ